MKIIVLRERCTGLANCIGVAPEVFDLDKEGRVVVDPLNADDHTLLRAARGCNRQAIILLDDQGHQVYL